MVGSSSYQIGMSRGLPGLLGRVRGDQCDACGATYEANGLKHPVSKLNPEIPVESGDGPSFFRLDLLQGDLENHAASRKSPGSRMSGR